MLGVGFLLAQLGAHSASRFAARVAPLGLTPPQVGILRAITDQPGRRQQALADEFGIPASRIVGFLDELEERGLVERRRDPSDRRVHSIHLSDRGQAMVRELATVARQAERELLRALSPDERRQLFDVLARIADQQGLTRGVHPGYRHL
jgi:DNA-binding MarR family transcriptional regulator